MKKLLLIIICSPIYTFSQIGVNTNTPQKDLHVNGSLQVTKELNVGGDATTAGNAGNADTSYIASQGEGESTYWIEKKDLSALLPTVGFFELKSTGQSVAGSSTFNLVPGLSTTFNATKSGTLILQLSAYAAIPTTSSGTVYYTNTQIGLSVNSSYLQYAMLSPAGSNANGLNPMNVSLTNEIQVTAGESYVIEVLARDIYNSGATGGASVGSFTPTNSTDSITSTLLATFIPD